MLTYKDKTFCAFYWRCKHGSDCDRALTPEVIERAEKAGLEIGRFLSAPECYVDKAKH